MRRAWLWLLLAVSLALNVFFVGGAVYSRYTATRLADAPEQRIALVAERLSMDTAQRDGLVALRRWSLERRSALRGDGSSLRDEILEQLAEPRFDRERVAALLSARSEQRQAFFLDLAAEMHAYLATLTPEQRASFLAMARERGFLGNLLGSRRGGE